VSDAQKLINQRKDKQKMNLKKMLSLVLCVAMILSTMSFNVFAEETTYVAKIGDVSYESFSDALAAAKLMTDEVTVEIYDKVTLNSSLSGDYSSIKFVGKSASAEIYLDVQGYITATGKAVAFEDLTLSKSEGGFITNAGFMNVAFGIYDVNSVSYTNCTFSNGAYASSGDVTFTGCTFYKSHDKYGLWAYGDVDAIVDDCVFADYRGVKMYAEGKAKTTNLTVKDTDFSQVNDKPAIVLTYGESVILEGNTYSSTGVFELDKDGAPNGTSVTSTDDITCVNDDGACGVLVGNKIYTKLADAVEVAKEGDTVTLLHDSTEEVTFAQGVVLDKNGYTADNATVLVPVEVATYEELVAALAKDKSVVVMKNDITATATQSSGYGAAGIVVDAGDVLDGNGYKLEIWGADGTWDCAIAIKGGTVKNLTVAKAFRGMFMPGANGDVVIDNCKIDKVCYTFNSDDGSKEYGVTIKNTVLNGWTSFSDAHKFVTFENCTFGKGTGGYQYEYCRPYQPTTFTGCEFNKGYTFDASAADDNTLAFNECTYDGKDLSAGNGMEMFSYGGNIKVDGEDANLVNNPVAKIGLTTYAKLADAIAAAQDGDTIYVTDKVNAETVKLPAQIKNLTIAGGTEDAMLKDSTIMAADGNSINYDGLTIKNLTFDNSRISITGWRTNGASVKNLVVENNTFKNLDDTTNSAPLHINMAATEPVNGFTFTNNVIDGATGGSKSGIYAQVTGDAIVSNNVINNVAFRPFVIQLTTDDGIDDSFVVEGNTFSNNSEGRLQALGNNKEGTDNVNLVITNNIINEVPDAQEICYWNFNPETTTTKFSHNYFGANIIENPNGIYFNKAAGEATDLVDMGIFPYYDKLNADGTIDTDSLVNGKDFSVAMIGDVPYTSLQNATNAAMSGDVIKLSKNITESIIIKAPAAATFAMRSIPSGVTIDLNNFTITGSVIVEAGATATLKNGTVSSETTGSADRMFKNYGNLTLDNVVVTDTNRAENFAYTITNYDGGEMTIKDSTINGGFGGVAANGGKINLVNSTSTSELYHGIYVAANGEVVVESGTYAHTTADRYAYGICVNGGKATINGGSFSGGVGGGICSMNNGQIEINDGKFTGAINATSGSVTINNGLFSVDPSAFIAADSELIDRGAYDYSYGVAKKAAGKISVTLEKTDNKNVYDIVINSDGKYDIYEFVSAELTFENNSTTVGGSYMDYEIKGYAANKTFAQEAKDAVGLEAKEEQYIISLNAGAERLSGDAIIIGQVEFFGQGDIDFKVTKGEVDTTWQNTNLGRYYVNDGNDATTDDALVLGDDASINDNIPEVNRDVTVNVAFNHNIDTKNYWDDYQITATIKNSAMDFAVTKDITIKNIKSGACTFEDVPVGYITVTLKAPGFRTYTYNTTLEETKDNGVLVLNFWNDVKRGNDEAIESGKAEMADNFVVGDIVMDYEVDKYDLAAVTSYYGMYSIDKAETSKYIKYDLNRDGDIDIRDVQYVLHTMGN